MVIVVKNLMEVYEKIDSYYHKNISSKLTGTLGYRGTYRQVLLGRTIIVITKGLLGKLGGL